MALPDILLLIAMVLTVAAYGVYWWGIEMQLVRPSRTSWLIWSAITTVEALTYQAVNEGLLQNVIFFMNAASCLFITFAIWRHSTWQKPSAIELLCMALSLAAMIVWFGFQQAQWAHILILAAVPIGFLPTWISAREDKRRELSPAWGLWTLADATTLLLILRTSEGGAMELPYILLELVCHATVWLIIGLGSIDPRQSTGLNFGSFLMRNAHKAVDKRFSLDEGKAGKTVRSRARFAVGDEIWTFSGPRYLRSEIRVNLPGSADRFLQIDKDEYIGPSGDIDDIFNHSCDPNAALDFREDSLVLVAVKPIDPGDEICWDYSTTSSCTTFWMRCLCGSPRCRKVVGDFEFLEPQLQEEYRRLGWVAPYLRRPEDGQKPLAA
jgi:SET domain